MNNLPAEQLALYDQYQARVRELAHLIREHRKYCKYPPICVGQEVERHLIELGHERRESLLIVALQQLSRAPWRHLEPDGDDPPP